MRRSKPRSKIKRKLIASIYRQKLVNPYSLLTPKRIDLAAKTIFSRAYIEGNRSSWPEHVYKEHLRAFNNFYENDPPKHSYEEFRDSFINTINSIDKDDGWKHKAPVVVNESFLVNGAHRVAASLVLKDKINMIIAKDAQIYNWNYSHFKSTREHIPNIDEEVLDYMTIEYVSLKKENIFVAVIFPTAEGHREEAYQHLVSLGEVVNMKSFKNDEFIGKEVIKQLYCGKNDDWNLGLDYNAAKYKADLCFAGKGDLQVYVLEANLDETTRIKEKQYLRNLWKKDKHSIHITDTIHEANLVTRMFFNENSRNILKTPRENEFKSQRMQDYFNEYLKLIPKNAIESEKIAIEGSAVLDLLNIREARDIDYITWSKEFNVENEYIEKHNTNENEYHTQNIDEILTNPKYYFYYKGCKFIDVKELLEYKKNRSINGDEKDINDVKLIKKFIAKNPQFSVLKEKKINSIIQDAKDITNEE